MGLDQYSHREDRNGEATELSYWRKHNALQGWMEKLWAIKTGKPEDDLNCNELEITAEDLAQLKKHIQNQTLPVTQGFFFGPDTSRDETRQEYDLEFVARAEKAIEEGDQVFYSCSW
ncbi:phosphoglycerate kinase [bacterium]|nr:phosphoglycerate kinase [bacterium]